MPHLGHHEPDLSDTGLSAAGTPPVLPQDPWVQLAAARTVARAAHDDDDRLMLLDQLGLLDLDASGKPPVQGAA